MFRLLGCLGKTAVLGILLVLVGMAWLGRDGDAPGDASSTLAEAATPEVAREVEARFEAAVTAGSGARIELSETELASLLLHGLEARLPGGMAPASVEISEGEVRIGGEVPLSLLPESESLRRIRGWLPERVPVEIRSTILAVEEGAAILLLRRVSVAGIPLPRAAYAALLPGLNAEGDELPPEAIRVALPPGIGGLRVDGDRVVVEVAD